MKRPRNRKSVNRKSSTGRVVYSYSGDICGAGFNDFLDMVVNSMVYDDRFVKATIEIFNK